MSNITTEQLRHSTGVKALLLVNIAVFVVQLVNPRVVDAFAIAGPPSEVLTRPWTLVTAFFLHDNPGHLVLMLAMLVVFGVALETITRTSQVVLIYLAGGLAGSLAIMAAAAIVGPEVMMGSSAAVFALAAAFAALRPDAKLFGSKAKQWAAILLLVNVPFAFVSVLSSVAHVAGLAVGAAIGYRLRTAATVEPSRRSAIGADR
jgi:membrane associated rhomboid family serine protease